MVAAPGNEEFFRSSMNQGHSAAWEGRWQEAVEHYSHALQEFPDNPPALNSLALAYLELGSTERALELYDRAARLLPEDPLPIERAAEIYAQMGRKEAAIEFSDRAADLYLKQRDADKAIQNWTRILRLEPEEIGAHQKLAQAFERLGRTPQAISEFISVAALQQHAGLLDEARASGERALKLNPQSDEAQQAVAMLQAFKSLPKPLHLAAPAGPIRLQPGEAKSALKPDPHVFEESSDPVEEATQKALKTLAGLVFESTSEESNEGKKGVRSRKSKGQKSVSRHLNQAIELQLKNKLREACEELKSAIESGLDHPAAHFDLGALLVQTGHAEKAQPSLQRAAGQADFALATHLLLGDYLFEEGSRQEAVLEYLRALEEADAAVVPAEKSESLRQKYAPLISAASHELAPEEIDLLCKNIRYLLMRPSWRGSVYEARGQLPGGTNGASPQPVLEILADADSVRLVDGLARINQMARQGHFRAAMDEAFGALELSPGYLPLHILIANLLLMSNRPQHAAEKLATVARVYQARGEDDRATQIYERIVSVYPLDINGRKHLIDQLIAQGDKKRAVSQTLDLADVYYRLAQLDQARETYENALRLAQSAHADAALNAQILHHIADIDLQRLEWREALLIYEQLRTLAPDDETARLNLVQLNLRLGQEAPAEVELDRYLSYLNSRSRAEDAGKFLRTLVDENPRFALGHRRLAEYLQQIGERDQAVQEWNRVGELLVEAGDREGAKTVVRAILALNPPDAERYQQFLQRLNQ